MTLKSSQDLSLNMDYDPKKRSSGVMASTGIIASLNKRVAIKVEADYYKGFFNTGSDIYYKPVNDNLNILLVAQFKITK